MAQQAQTQRVTDLEVELAKTMLRIAADIDHLGDLTHQQPASPLGSSPALERTAEDLRVRVEQTAHLKGCSVLLQLVEDDRRRRDA